MKGKLLSLTCLFAVTVLITSGAIMTPAVCNPAPSKEKLITVMNPAITEMPAKQVSLAPRLDTLRGKTIYLVDLNYEGINGTPVMGEIQAWFTKNMPDVKTLLKLKKGSYIADDPALWKEIADSGGDGVILGVAG
ncbi:MAG: hypothetical protein JW896_10125 [Deltaproteobacteria bacterium]|nr:hypothetical protein [Deltaproteobacteria bacterium]